MAGQIIDVPGVGQVAFPEGMSDADISSAITTHILPKYAQEGGGVTDAGGTTPLPRGDVIAPGNMPKDEAAGWAVTRLRNAATGLAGLPRTLSDLGNAGIDELKLPDWAKTALRVPFALPGMLPSGGEMNRTIENKTGIQPVNMPGAAGPAIDAGTEAAIGALAGGPRALIPSFTGGAAQEAVGSQPEIKGTPWETPIRLGTALFGSLAPAGIQRGVEAVTRSAALRSPADRAASLLGRNLNRDNMTFGDLAGGHMPGTPLVTNAGDNVTGALRGTTAAQGPARTTVNKAFENYTEGSEGRVGDAISKNISDLPPISTRTNTLKEGRSEASGEAYDRAGVPNEPRMVKFAMDQPPVPNSRIIKSPELDKLIASSKDIQDAITTARRLPEFKDQPVNSMAMLDKIYKHVGGLETGAKTPLGVATEQSRDIGKIRTQLKDEITRANPDYGRALDAFSEPSALIGAAKKGNDWFAKNRPIDEVAREYGALRPDQRREALGGIASYLRTKMGGTDRMTAGERLLNSGNERGRLQAVLPPEDYEKFNALIEQEKAVAAKGREVTKGSRSITMANEQADNAGLDLGAGLGILHKVATGNFKLAALDLLRTAASPIAKRMMGKSNEATNATLANWLTETDLQKIGLVRSLAERAQAQETTRRLQQQRGLMFGTLAPTVGAVSR